MRELHPELPRLAVVHQGSVEQGEALLKGRWPDALAIADPDLALYGAFGLGRGSVGEVLGAGAWVAAARAALKGNFVGLPVGDPWVMPGMFLAHGDRILWRHEFRHVGDLPPVEDIVAAAAG